MRFFNFLLLLKTDYVLDLLDRTQVEEAKVAAQKVKKATQWVAVNGGVDRIRTDDILVLQTSPLNHSGTTPFQVVYGYF